MAGAVGVAGEGEDLGVVDQAVDHRGRDDVVGEGLTPAPEGQVRSDHDRALLVAGRDELEEQVRGVLVERDVANLVDLWRPRHRSTYADLGIMPTCPRRDPGISFAQWVLAGMPLLPVGIFPGVG